MLKVAGVPLRSVVSAKQKMYNDNIVFLASAMKAESTNIDIDF